MSAPRDRDATGSWPLPRPSPGRGRVRRAVGILLRLVVLLAVLGVGLALGDAYGDRPTRPSTISVARGVDVVTVTRSVATLTRTIVVTRAATP